LSLSVFSPNTASMIRIFSASTVLIIACASASVTFAQSPSPKTYADKITVSGLRDNVSVLASDALEGRKTATRGQKMAAAFIAYQFEEIGLEAPVHDSNNRSYYQSIPLYATTLGDAYLKVNGTTYPQVSGLVFSRVIDSGGEVSVPLVFAGYGSEADFKAIDVTGKAVLLFLHDSTSRAADRATKLGAKMIMTCDLKITGSFEWLASDINAYKDHRGWNIVKPVADPQSLIRIRISKEMLERVMGAPEKKLVDAATKNRLTKIKPQMIQFKSSVVQHTTKTENVLGYLEGTDKKDEVVVVSAHYDHIGINDSPDAVDKINNGADDDASGTSSVMEIARQFSQAKKDGHGPRRSMLFIAFVGEEQGLWGSLYYTDHPVFPLEKTVVDLNIDMVGRSDSAHEVNNASYVYVIGSDKLSSELHALSEAVNEKNIKLSFDYTYNQPTHPERIYYRSDHWNFAKNNIPIIFYFDGIHKDYHRPSDEISKIDFGLMTKRARAIFYTAWEIANREKRPTVDPDKVIKQTK
jgi:hypothetical protein